MNTPYGARVAAEKPAPLAWAKDGRCYEYAADPESPWLSSDETERHWAMSQCSECPVLAQCRLYRDAEDARWPLSAGVIAGVDHTRYQGKWAPAKVSP
jgi:hypothetical protein